MTRSGERARPVRVVVCGTGFVGRMVLRELAERPDFEIASVIVHAAEKDGLDAGEVVGIGPIGVCATRDADAALACGADALAYFGPTAQYAAQNIARPAADPGPAHHAPRATLTAPPGGAV